MIQKTMTATALLFGVAQAGLAFADEIPTHDAPVSMDLTFIFHVDQELAEQDLFFERQPGSGKVYRPTAADRDMAAPLYATAIPVGHTPLETEYVGPWPKGKPLDMTLGQWFEASGEGSYSCVDGEARMDITFANLVPDGVYTMWHFFFAWPPTEPFIGTYDIPIGSRDGSESVFTADAAGNARLQRTFKPCLQLSGEQLTAGLAVAWHSDGKTYGHEPGEFSTDSHVHLYVPLPKHAGI